MNLVTVKTEFTEYYPWPDPLLFLGNVTLDEVTVGVVVDGDSKVHIGVDMDHFDNV